jgi:phosphoglycerol geranylgeranyltransferase
MFPKVFTQFSTRKQQGRKSLAVLLDPDKASIDFSGSLIGNSQVPDFFFVGGSLLFRSHLPAFLQELKASTSVPIVLFPGNSLHVDKQADAILFLSLISGRNPEFLIGQHVVAAPYLKAAGIEVMPTGYLLIEGGKPSTVSYMSNTTPIPADKPEIAACTAMAGEMLGLKLLYLDAGSGVSSPVPPQVIEAVASATEAPLIVGGGINTPEKAWQAWQAGADVVVVGNALEENPGFFKELSQAITPFNLPSSGNIS